VADLHVEGQGAPEVFHGTRDVMLPQEKMPERTQRCSFSRLMMNLVIDVPGFVQALGGIIVVMLAKAEVAQAGQHVSLADAAPGCPVHSQGLLVITVRVVDRAVPPADVTEVVQRPGFTGLITSPPE
jgi:hypothetical protein